MESAEIVILGAGFAGAAAAYQLTRMGVSDVLIVEKEDSAGMHSSGRNAAMIRQVVGSPDIAELAREGAAFVRDLPSDWEAPVEFDPNGSLLLASGETLKTLECDMEDGRNAGLEVDLWNPAQCLGRVPVLEGAEFQGAVWCPSDGMIDAAGLLQGFLSEARKGGARLRTKAEVAGFKLRGDRIDSVLLPDGPVRAGAVINATGAWARQVGLLAGALDLELIPFRRHLYSTGRLDWVDPAWPFVWDVGHDVYFRPESHGLLTSPCDEAAWTPELPKEDPKIIELLSEKLERYLPRLADVPILRGWAGLRTMAPDRRFVIGRDPKIDNFVWAAGLGGHGVTVSAAAGALVARSVVESGGLSGGPFDPGRFV